MHAGEDAARPGPPREGWDPPFDPAEEIEGLSDLPPEERSAALESLVERLEQELEATGEIGGEPPPGAP